MRDLTAEQHAELDHAYGYHAPTPAPRPREAATEGGKAMAAEAFDSWALILTPHEVVVLSAILAGACEQWNAALDQLDQGERDLLQTVERIRSFLPPVVG